MNPSFVFSFMEKMGLRLNTTNKSKGREEKLEVSRKMQLLSPDMI